MNTIISNRLILVIQIEPHIITIYHCKTLLKVLDYSKQSKIKETKNNNNEIAWSSLRLL